MDWRDDPRFVAAVEELMQSEGPRGEIANDPHDPGGLTRWGISSRSYPKVNVRNLSRDDACAIYYRDFWVGRRVGDIQDYDLASEVLDLIVTNPTAIIRALQHAIPKTGGTAVEADGHLGNVTLYAVNTHPNPKWLLDRFRIEAIKFYKELNRSRFLASWVGRTLAWATGGNTFLS